MEQIVPVFVISIIVFVIFLPFIHYAYCHRTISTETITIRDKGIIVTGNDQGTHSEHMIYTTNGQALKNTNSLWFKKWNSDELQSKLQIGKTYKIKTYGIRKPFLGLYKHIISATEIKPTKRKKKN